MALKPRIPNAPITYAADYFEQIFRVLLAYFESASTSASNGSINDYSTLPTTGYNLRIGHLYVESGVVKVVLLNVVYLKSFATTITLGTVIAS